MSDTNSQRLGQYGTVPLDFFILVSLPLSTDDNDTDLLA